MCVLPNCRQARTNLTCQIFSRRLSYKSKLAVPVSVASCYPVPGTADGLAQELCPALRKRFSIKKRIAVATYEYRRRWGGGCLSPTLLRHSLCVSGTAIAGFMEIPHLCNEKMRQENVSHFQLDWTGHQHLRLGQSWSSRHKPHRFSWQCIYDTYPYILYTSPGLCLKIDLGVL